MKLDGVQTRSIWLEPDGWRVGIFDQRKLPWATERLVLASMADAAAAIAGMATRGAPLIGAVAAYGLAPTLRAAAAYAEATRLCDEDVAVNRAIGEAGLPLIAALAERKAGAAVNILMHCNPGWLATVDWGTATAPIYLAHDAGIAVHVWVDETRPRNQGALTAFELAGHGVPHSYIVDNAGGHYSQRGAVDMVLVGTDRVAANGDVCNKIGTYLKALAARAHGVPFYVALPSSTYDPATASGDAIPIEERSGNEVAAMAGPDSFGALASVTLTRSPVRNPAFDITPADLVTAYITEAGVLVGPRDLAAAFPLRA